MKRVAILGSTGSIGVQALSIIGENPDRFEVVSLSANKNFSLLAEQTARFRPKVVAMADEGSAERLKEVGSNVSVLAGDDGVRDAVTESGADILLSCAVGAKGLIPTVCAIDRGIDIALANKESLVAAGEIVMAKAKEKGVKIIPVDSEHSAIFQAIKGHDYDRGVCVKRLILTASGGPFWERDPKTLSQVTPEEAARHPRWKMGKKISVDSATMINKALEIIEARWLFDISKDRIDVLIHPQSIVHSMVEYIDGSIIAQLGTTDMRIPIAYALSFPERIKNPVPPLDLARLSEGGVGLTFFDPDFERFPALSLAYDALKAGGTMPAVMSAANESAVEMFLGAKLGFLDIVDVVSEVMLRHKSLQTPNLEEILEADLWARGETEKVVFSR